MPKHSRPSTSQALIPSRHRQPRRLSVSAGQANLLLHLMRIGRVAFNAAITTSLNRLCYRDVPVLDTIRAGTNTQVVISALELVETTLRSQARHNVTLQKIFHFLDQSPSEIRGLIRTIHLIAPAVAQNIAVFKTLPHTHAPKFQLFAFLIIHQLGTPQAIRGAQRFYQVLQEAIAHAREEFWHEYRRTS